MTEEELTRLEGQLNHIVDQYAVFADLDTDHIPPTAQTIEVENILREDATRPGLSTEEALSNAPARSGDESAGAPVQHVAGGVDDSERPEDHVAKR